MGKVIETNLIIGGLLKEQEENNESFMKKMLMDLGVVIDGTFTFGTGITAFLPTVRELLQGGGPVITEQEIVLLYITAMWILLKRNEDKIEKALKIIREKGLTDLLAKVYDFLESTEDIVIKMADEVGYTASRITDITAFTFMTFPILDVLSGLIRDNTISVDNPGGYLKSVLISIGILSVKNGFNAIIKRIRNKYGNLNENKKPRFGALKENKEDNLYNVMTTDIVKDIMKSIKKTIPTFEQTTIYLPEEINGELTYNGTNVSVEITISRNEELKEEFLVESFYSPEDDVIELGLELNPLMEPDSYENVYSFLIEYIRHELEHYDQNIKGELPPNDDDGLSNLEYYLQPHEIPAQVKGLGLRASKTKQSYEDVVRKSVEHSKQRYGLTDIEASKLYTKLLDGIEYQLSNSLLKEDDGMDGGKKEKIILDNKDVQVIVPFDYDTFCYYANRTTWCDSNSKHIWTRCNTGTCYIVIDKNVKGEYPHKNIIVNNSKIPMLIQKGDSLGAFDDNSRWIKPKSVLSRYPEISKLLKVSFTDTDKLRYDMPFTQEEERNLATTNSFAETIYKIMYENMSEYYIEDYLGDDFILWDDPYGNRQYGEGVEIHLAGITLKIEDKIFKEDYLLLDEDDEYYLDMGLRESDSPYAYEDEQDEEELNYMSCWFTKDTYKRLMELFTKTGIVSTYEKNQGRIPACAEWEEGDMVNLLETYFGSDWDQASWEILSEIGYGIGYMRRKNMNEYLKEDMTLPFEVMGDGYDVFMTWSQLLYIVGTFNIKNLSEIKGTEILELEGGLSDVWYDGYDWGPDTEKHVSEIMDTFIESSTEKIEKGDFKKNTDNYLQIVDDLGYKKKWVMGRDLWSKSLPGKVITIQSFDALTNLLKMTIQTDEGKKEYEIKADDLTNYTVSDELFSNEPKMDDS